MKGMHMHVLKRLLVILLGLLFLLLGFVLDLVNPASLVGGDLLLDPLAPLLPAQLVLLPGQTLLLPLFGVFLSRLE